MKLSEVLTLKNFLQDIDLDTSWHVMLNNIHNIKEIVTSQGQSVGPVSQEVLSNVDSVYNSVTDLQHNIFRLCTELDQAVSQRENEYYVNSQRLYDEEMRWETNDYILNRKLIIDNDSNNLMRNRIRGYSDWRLPGLIIRPGLETFIEDMVPLDPLYVVDQHQDLIAPSVEKFTIEYQRRLRQYVINDYIDEQPLHQLPDNQFGLIFAYNFLNYKPLPVIERYLKDFYRKLRPGGVAMFTFNNCDLAQGMAFAESYYQCYTPGSSVRRLLDQIGFENLHDQNLGANDVSWLEIKKPGEIQSLRGGQTLARIVRK